MAEIISNGSRRRGKGVRRKMHSLKTDMTPMVDLGFLLIAFFVMTSELTKPRIMRLNVPKEGADMPVAKSTALTILLGKDNSVYYYEGELKDAIRNNRIIKSRMSLSNGIGEVIMAKQKELDLHPVNGEKREGLLVIIKPGREARYKQVVDILDEMEIYQVKKYCLVGVGEEETRFMQ